MRLHGESEDQFFAGESFDNLQGVALLRSGLKLSHLRMIVAIEEHKQVSAAADALNISQPAASRMLTEMETILKAQLCDRVSRGVALTAFGRAFARRVAHRAEPYVVTCLDCRARSKELPTAAPQPTNPLAPASAPALSKTGRAYASKWNHHQNNAQGWYTGQPNIIIQGAPSSG